MKTRPLFLTRIEERKTKRQSTLENEHLQYLIRRNTELDKDISRYMNVNNSLWLALSKLPGGLELARKISK